MYVYGNGLNEVTTNSLRNNALVGEIHKDGEETAMPLHKKASFWLRLKRPSKHKEKEKK